MRAHGGTVRARPSRLRSLALVGVPVLLALVGCGGGGVDNTVTVASVSAAASTSPVAQDSTPQTTEPPTSVTPSSSTSTSVPDATGGLHADQQAEDTTWESNASDFRGEDGQTVLFACPRGGAASSVWGSGPYTDDSSVCTAAVHAGLITLQQGGWVVIEIGGGQAGFMSTERHGITTSDYESWPGSYRFPNAPSESG